MGAGLRRMEGPVLSSYFPGYRLATLGDGLPADDNGLTPLTPAPAPEQAGVLDAKGEIVVPFPGNSYVVTLRHPVDGSTPEAEQQFDVNKDGKPDIKGTITAHPSALHNGEFSMDFWVVEPEGKGSGRVEKMSVSYRHPDGFAVGGSFDFGPAFERAEKLLAEKGIQVPPLPRSKWPNNRLNILYGDRGNATVYRAVYVGPEGYAFFVDLIDPIEMENGVRLEPERQVHDPAAVLAKNVGYKGRGVTLTKAYRLLPVSLPVPSPPRLRLPGEEETRNPGKSPFPAESARLPKDYLARYDQHGMQVASHIYRGHAGQPYSGKFDRYVRVHL